ncbi:MAG TPA: hypothetical protein VK803_06875 [Steroidobacteraceae bacterium]|nr:hypothetical protein [Steroidobacteraceae bacterium]
MLAGTRKDNIVAMETNRLRTLQQPSHVERLLEVFSSRADIVPEDAYRIRDPDALPMPLQRLASKAGRDGRAWICWARALRTWLLTCEVSLPASREHQLTVLDVNIYAEDGELQEAGSWQPDHDGRWQRCAV